MRIEAIKISPAAPTTSSLAINGPTNWVLMSVMPPNLLSRSFRMLASWSFDSGLVVIRTWFEPACWTVPSTLKVSTSFWTAVAWIGCLKVRLSWLPPAKSMPRRNPTVAIEMMPGRMIRSESRKYQLRRPTMFIG